MSNTFFQEMAEKSAVANFIFNLTTLQFEYSNQAMLALLDADADSVNINLLSRIIHPDDQPYALNALKHLTELNSNTEIHLRLTLSNKQKWLRVNVFLSQAGGLLFGNAVDVTNEIESQQVFEKYANKKNAIINILAHDLIGPLGTINMLGSSLKSTLTNGVHVNLIDSILKINKQATNLVKQLTAREFAETKDVILSKKRVNISKILCDYLEEYQNSFAHSQRSFRFSSTPNDIFINLDEPKFMQVMNNLMTNAMKFTPEDGYVALNVEENNDEVNFVLADNGIGIPADYQAILFDKFTDAGRKGLQGEPSIGLGMFVVKNIIEWHQGKVWVESNENSGTHIYFTLPKY
ncbi:HAMP domain-containing sensor histidine kinase [uncultured Mucilaginibacter sp.]|uniref:sensor histidine kinase n=1 Tax=uncultured Mucilaginibacter sp. TaxID=797541 RepID=UPI0025E96DA1|nr:HAMP domain-containing sensor histidine kinase [uncultured Mucilaginibacter sp.]